MAESKQQAIEVRKNIKVIIELEPDTSLGHTLSTVSKPMQELIQDVDLTDFLDDNKCLKLKKLLILIKNQYNFPLQNKQIYFYLDQADIFMNCGIDPISEDIKIRPQNYENIDLITIKGKDLKISMVHRLMSFENNAAANEERDRAENEDNAQKSKCRRTKQRRIGHIIDKVIEWRKYYTGAPNEKNLKLSLEEAAREVKISKKSLDDYLFQIRFGHRYGFNFNEHFNDKVGVLRDFVRQKKKTDKTDNKNRKNQIKALDRERDQLGLDR